jgi:DNA-directed RNA polymerase subunit H (RpoH/RPB5)
MNEGKITPNDLATLKIAHNPEEVIQLIKDSSTLGPQTP